MAIRALPPTKKRVIPTKMPSPISRVTTPSTGNTGIVPPKTPDARSNALSSYRSAVAQRVASKPGQKQGAPYEPNKQVRDFQPYGVGKPRYGGGRSAPNVGPVTGTEGYKERDLKNRVMKSRAQKMLKKRQQGQVS